MSRWLPGLLFGLAGGLIALLAERIVFPSPAIARVDLQGLVAAHLRQPDLQELSEPARAQRAAAFATRLERETAGLAREYHAVLLAAPAVIAGAPDLTAVLRQRIEARTP